MRESGVVELIFQGGILMFPIMLTSVIALAIALERFIVLRRTGVDTREFMDAMRTVLRQNRVQEAIEICDEHNTPIARIVKAGLLKSDRGREEIREAMEDAAHLELPRLDRYMSALGTCASVAPLLGLLGTVQGMIKAFAKIQDLHGQVNPADLAEGIGNALITTAAGLTVAIPTLVVYNYFVARTEHVVNEMEVSASELADLLTKERPDYEYTRNR